MFRLSAFLVALIALCAAPSGFAQEDGGPTIAEESDNRPAIVKFRDAQDVLVRADEVRDGGDIKEARKLYDSAAEMYDLLSREYPDWQPGVTQFRLNYCINQINALEGQTDGPPPVSVDEAIPEPALTSLPPRGPSRLEDIRSEAAALLRRGKTVEARTVLIRGFDIDPDDVGVRVLMGTLHCRNGDYENAMYLMRTLVDEHPELARAQLVLGAAYLGMGDIAGAAEHMNLAIDADPELGEAHYDLAQILLVSEPRDLAAAKRHYDLSVELGGRRDSVLESQLP